MNQKYLGITPYDEKGNFKFAGRNEETWALYDRIVRNEYTVYYAASGEGKSSLIRAGLIPILLRRDFFPIYIVFKDDELKDLSLIEDVINDRINEEKKKTNLSYGPSSILLKSNLNDEKVKELESNLWWKLRNYSFWIEDTELTPLFIFDQFEEVFTKANYEWTDKFFTWLEEISTDYLPNSLRDLVESLGINIPTHKNFKALFSFRTEYLGDLDYWCVQKHFLPSLQENRMCLKPMTPKGAREVIALNESLKDYSNEIINGCAETSTNTENENQPCVYALILSVVCHTLSEISDSERIKLLNDLKNDKNKTIDDILLRFYKKKLKAAGLDYIKNAPIISEIEKALVDVNGKRCRRDMNESMQPLSKWIGKLCDKDNGLLKIIAKKEVKGTTINTVEFPHDRLCKAIDTARKERQGRIEWQLNRQSEWTQFSVVTAIICIIAYLWNSMMPAIKPVIHNILNFPNKNVSVWLDAVFKALKKYLEIPYDNSQNMNSIDMGCSTIILMAMLLVFVPLLTVFIMRKDKKWYIVSSITSFISSFGLGYLIYRNNGIEFEDNYVPLITIIVFCASIFVFIISGLRLKKSFNFKSAMPSGEIKPSLWPLWGGFFIFSIYAFYEFLFRTTFGINEPCDSCWVFIVLPVLYLAWAWGYFCMKTEKTRIISVFSISIFVGVIALLLLAVISYIPFYNAFKQQYGFTCSIILIVLSIIAFIYIIWTSKSNSNYYIFSNAKRLFVTLFGAMLLLGTFGLNLGYNPICIAPNTVCHVSSLRTVLVYEKDTVGNKKYGILYATGEGLDATGSDTIIPCVVYIEDSVLRKSLSYIIGQGIPIKTVLTKSPFGDGSEPQNSDASLRWYKDTLTAYIPLVPTLEQYLYDKIKRNVSDGRSLTESIDYYAAKLFGEMRKANINYAINHTPYNLDDLSSLRKLDSLQYVALLKELAKLSTKNTIILPTDDSKRTSDKNTIAKDTIILPQKNIKIKDRQERPFIEMMEDKHLVDLHRELSRSILLCLIKDRAAQKDMSAMFTLLKSYSMLYFSDVLGAGSINAKLLYDFKYNENINGKKNQKDGSKNIDYQILADDLHNRKLFAWYYLFDYLCWLDISWNSTKYYKDLQSNFETLNNDLSNQNEIIKELQSLSKTATLLDNESASLGKNTDVAKLLDYFIEVHDSNKYKKMLSKLSENSLTLNIIVAEESLNRINRIVLYVLLDLMKKQHTNIYDNDFENICKNLILISTCRGYDVKKDRDSISNYIKEKNDIFNLVDGIENKKKYINDYLEMKEKT